MKQKIIADLLNLKPNEQLPLWSTFLSIPSSEFIYKPEKTATKSSNSIYTQRM